MPAIKKAQQKPSNIGEQIQPNPNPTVLPAPPLPSTVPSRSPNFLAPSPSVVTNPDDWQRQFFQPGVSQSRVLPLPVKSNPQNNAVASNVAKNVVAPVQAQVSQIQQAVLDIQATSFQGAWSAEISYQQAASVDYLGNIYVSLINNNIGNNPVTSPAAWATTGAVGSYTGAWESSTTYITGQTASVSTSLYMALQDSLNENPVSTNGYWQLLSKSSVYYGNWSSSIFYPVGGEVTYNGAFWVAVSANTNQTPSTTSSYWDLVGTACALIGPWTSGVSYVKNNQVQFDSNLYSCLQANTASSGNAPPNNQYWQLLGSSVVQLAGKQALYNGNFETNAGGFPQNSLILAAASGAYVVDGWSTSISAIGSVYLDNVNPHSGNLDVVIQPIKSSESLPSNNTYYGTLAVSQPVPVSSGEVLQISGWIALGTQGSLIFPSGVTFIGRVFLNFLDQNGNAIGQAYPFADQTALTSYVYSQLSSQVTVASTYGSGKPSAMQVVCAGYIKNNSGSTFSTTSSNGLNVYFDDLQVIPVSNLDTDVIDGSQRFAASASTLSYRPTSNPLASVDAGGGTSTINIASFAMLTSNKGSISVNSGSIAGVSQGVQMWVYYDDPQLLGASVSFNATTSKTTALNGSGRFCIGSINTAIAGGPETFGANDGGLSAQGGGTGVFLGGTSSSSGTGSVTNPSYAYNGNMAEYTDILANTSSATETYILSGFQPSQCLGTLTLFVRSQALAGSGGSATLSFSTDGGSTFTNIYSVTTNRALTLDSVTLGYAQNPALLQVKCNVTAGTSGVGHIELYQAWMTAVI